MASETIQPPAGYLIILENFIKNDMVKEANEHIKKWGLKVEVQNGQLVDTSNNTESWLHRFVTINPIMQSMKDDVRKLAKVESPVLIQGPTGTGKEIIAHALHGDREGAFIPVNCAGLPEQLVESILFGHVKGSYTGAHDTKQGLMKLAKNGTIFFDEIGELPLGIQAKLLRAIQEKKVLRVGGESEEDINCRIVAATHRDLKSMIKFDEFRVDLYARISTFELNLLPLCDRREDVEPIIKSLPGGEEYLKALQQPLKDIIITELNVRGLQQQVERYKVLGRV